MILSKVRLYSELLNSIDFTAWQELRARWIQSPSDAGFLKYFDYEHQLNKTFEILDCIGWPDKPNNVLDISTGFGWLPFVLKHLGCKITITDVNDEKNSMCQSVREFLSLPLTYKFKYEDGKFKPLPDTLIGFDLITALSVGGQDDWKNGAWKHFISDGISRLNSGGKLFVYPNRSENIIHLFRTAIEYSNVKIDKSKGWCLIWKD
jgi:16S rRNA G1207 methylase RsmC